MKVGDILKVWQGDNIHYERVIEITPEVITEDMNPDEFGDVSTQGLSANLKYEVMSNWRLAQILETSITKRKAFAIANKFYGSDYNLSYGTFEKALKELD